MFKFLNVSILKLMFDYNENKGEKRVLKYLLYYSCLIRGRKNEIILNDFICVYMIRNIINLY